MDEIPEWTIERALDRACDGYEYTRKCWSVPAVLASDNAFAAAVMIIARYIAQHEQPPRDKIREVAEALVEAYDGPRAQWMVGALARAMRKALPQAALDAIEEIDGD
jgi:hypothetical protein